MHAEGTDREPEEVKNPRSRGELMLKATSVPSAWDRWWKAVLDGADTFAQFLEGS